MSALDFENLETDAADCECSNDDCSVGSMGAGGFDTKRSLSSDLISEPGEFFNAEGVDPPGLDLRFDENIATGISDDIFQHIKDSVSRKQDGSKADCSSRSGSITDSPQVKTSDDYLSIPYGIQPRATYEHGKRSTEIMGVTYNGRMRQFIIIDSKGVTAWKRDAVDHRVNRVLYYPKYEYGVITHMVYAKKYNCYFALGKDFSLKVYNRDFFETCSVSADLRSVLFMLFNPVRDELITGGVGGTKVWRFHQQSGKSFTELKPLANYGLTLKYELPNVGGSWVKRVELDHHLEHLYCCSDTDLYVYDLGGKLLFKFERAHMMSITGCRYSLNAGVLVTSSIDCEVKVWSLMGGLVHTFRGHSRAVTNLILHPATSSIVITCSLDGTVRMWSLDTMDTLYSLVVSADGVHWMGLTDDNLLFLSTPRAITIWSLNYSHQFWALARSKVTKISLAGCKGKTTRVMAISDDSSVRLMARSNKKNLCTVLPPPNISPLQRVLSVCYSREFNVIFMLINPHEIWVYTTRTDPSCRIAVWDVIEVQATFSSYRSTTGAGDDFNPASTISVNKPAPTHRATESGSGNEPLANCCCVSILNSTAILWTEEGCCCPIRDSYLLLGLEDGRILFMDPVVKGHKYLEFKTGKDPVLDMSHDANDNCLSTVHKLKDRMLIQVWSLPDLELQHEVYVAPDLRAYARVGYVMACGHESGCVIFNTLELATDPGMNKGKMIPPYNEVIDSSHKPEHFEAVLGVDACAALKIFCSCSNDGAIKIWNEDGILMTELMLDESITSICFLNNMGDIIVGFQKHIFIIDHCRVCSQLAIPESDVDSFDKESFICEDPAVLYEGVTPNPDPVTLESYLVPFDIEFSKDFLEGRVKLEPEVVEEEESDKESEVSMAPTEVYHSPCSTPRRRLSRIDLMLGSEASSYDLLKQMKKTLKYLTEREHLGDEELFHQETIVTEKQSIAERRRRRRKMKKGLEDDTDRTMVPGEVEKEKDEVSESEDVTEKLTFEFPKFGESPGPTPVSTAPPTPEPESEEEEENLHKEEHVADAQMKVTIDILPKGQDDIAKFLEASQIPDFSNVKASPQVTISASTPRKKFGLSGYTIDAESLMKVKSPRSAKPDNVPPRTQVAKPSEVSLQISQAKSPRKEKSIKKRMSISNRRSSRAKKSDLTDEQERSGSPPSSQMETLKLTQQKLDVPEKKKFEMPVVDLRRNSQDFQEGEKEAMFYDRLAEKEKQFQTSDGKPHEVKPINAMEPELPALPDMPVQSADQKLTETLRSQKSQSPSLQTTGGPKRMAMDFGGINAKPSQPDQSELVLEDINDMPDGKSGQSPADMAKASVDSMPVVSGESESGQANFRIGLLSKQSADADEESQQQSLSRASAWMPDADSKTTYKPQQQNNKEFYTKDCSLDSVGTKAVNTKKTSKTGAKSMQKGKKGASQREIYKTQAKKDKKSEPDPKDLLQALMEKEKYKEAKTNPETKLPPDPEILLNALKIVEAEKNVKNQFPSPSTNSGSSDRSISSFQTLNTGVVGTFGIRDMYDHKLPSIPEAEMPADESDIRLPSPDFSIRRATTPSLSVIENESNHSVSPAPSLSRGIISPLPVLSEYPLHSSPLPPLDEASGQSWPSEIVNSENTTYLPVELNGESLPLDNEATKKLSTQMETSITLSSISAMSSQSVPELQVETSIASSVVSLQLDQERSASNSNEKQIKKELTNENRMISQEKGVADDTDKALLLAGNVPTVKIDSFIENKPQSPLLERPVCDLNQNIDPSMANPSLDTIHECPTDVNESQNSLASHNSPVSQVDISIKTVDGSVTQINEHTTPADTKEDECESRHSLAEIEDEEDEFSGENWDTDSNIFSPSDGSYRMTSSYSDSDSRHSKQTDKTINGQASSSSNTEPVLQVKIRRKAWSHYRNKQPTKQQSNDALRKMSHSDALTVQRKAYLETLRMRKKRSKSAVESNSFHLPGQQPAQQMHHTMLEMEPSQSSSQCIFCTAEGLHNHASHQSEEEKAKGNNKNVNVIESQGTPRGKSQSANVAFDTEVVSAASAPQSKTPGMDSMTLSDGQVSQVDKTPTPCDTPDPFNSQMASRPMSESSVAQFAAVSPDLSRQLSGNERLHKTGAIIRTESSQGDLSEEAAFPCGDEISYDADMMRVDILTLEDKDDGKSPGCLLKQGEDLQDKTDSSDLLPETSLKRARERPKTSLETASLGKPELDEAVKYFRQRPHTAQVKFQTEDLQEAYENSLTRYQNMARTPLASDNIHRNGDMAFSENWHGRQIERHMLIRMQKELRAQSARQRRQALEQRVLSRRKEIYSEAPSPAREAFLSTAFTASQPASHRSNTVHGFRPTIPIAAPTPVSSRPHTATGLYVDSSAQHQSAQMMFQQQNMERLSRLQEMEMMQREKSELSQQRAFRFRLSQKEVEEKANDTNSFEPPENVDLWMIDPRNPRAMRPKSSKSIPSKCHRYVLVSKPKVRLNLPLPSPLEEELLATRFPDQGERVFRKYEGLLYKPPRRPIYGIEYSPFQAQLH